MKKYLLAGTPNCGKTMLFNRLTGGHMRVANFPGITVEKKEGKLKKSGDILTDLPGTYSLKGFSPEEKVTQTFLMQGNYDVIINVLDSTAPEKSLPLTLQLLKLKKPMIVAANLSDISEKQGVYPDYKALSHLLGVPVIPISAKKGTNINLLEAALTTATPARGTSPDLKTVLSLGVKRTDKVTPSRKIDKIILHPYLALPIFFLIFVFIFALVFSPPVSRVGELVKELFSSVLPGILQGFLSEKGVNPLIINFIITGVFRGVSAVLSFLPQMAVLFAALTLLEDSGYMARAAFIADKPLSRIGLSGSSFVPILMGLGCTTSAILSSRTVSSPSCRQKTVLALPFISCGAKLPVYLLFAGAFFPHHAGLFVLLLYLLGIALFILSCIILGKGSGTFMPELPPYRIPSFKNVLSETRVRIWSFITRAGTVIFLFSSIMWFLQQTKVGGVPLISIIGGIIGFIFSPLGFGFPEASAAVISGLFAKEAVVSTLAVLTGNTGITGFFTSASALSFTVFISLYPACVSALGVMRREAGLASAVFSFIYQFLCAYIISAMVYFFACLVGI